MRNPFSKRVVAVAVAIAIGAVCSYAGYKASASAAQPTPTAPQTSIAQDELERLQTLLPDQAHAMADVGEHFTNLWFAGQSKNWPLADFYWNETRSHLRWAVRIKPVRVDSAKQEVKLAEILDALENSPLKQLKEAIDGQDPAKFVAAYRFTLEGCYACHKASEKQYLKPQIPQQPATRILNFDPTADWPK